MKRQTAWRIFAGEFNDSTVEIKSKGEMEPSFVVTPLGAKVNRLFVIGVLTDVENVSEDGGLVRAHISDPTGVFTLYSGQYQQDATDALTNIEAPAFVAVIGKARTYTPDDGGLYVSIRPEKIMEVTADVRDKWILETCKNTKERIEAVLEAMQTDDTSSVNLKKLKKLGFSQELTDGIIKALESYQNLDLKKYVALIQESLQYLKPGKETLADTKTEEKPKKEKKTKKEEKTKEEDVKESDSEETENAVFDTIKEIEGEEGAAWDLITEQCEKAGIDKDSIEEALNSLMDKGLIYEPILGTIKTT